jgi:hypothetical protein
MLLQDLKLILKEQGRTLEGYWNLGPPRLVHFLPTLYLSGQRTHPVQILY